MDYLLDSIDKIAAAVLNNVSSKIILLYGEMGTGKTTLVKALVRSLGSDDEVSSPTFSIVNEYEIQNDIVYHFDLYRLNDIEEAYNFGIEEYIFSDHWVIIEWPELIENIIPEGYNRIDLSINDNKSRTIKLNFESNFDKQTC